MDQLKNQFDATKKLYDQGRSPVAEICETVRVCLVKLSPHPLQPHGTCAKKSYSVYEIDGKKSRPILPKLFISDEEDFKERWDRLVASSVGDKHIFESTEAETNVVLYTAIMSFAACYDIWKSGSRKTPGTFFEVLLGSLISLILPSATRTKFIPLPAPKAITKLREIELLENEILSSEQSSEDESDMESGGNVSTDIVFNLPGGIGIVIPAKITTRERIVQPFAHQRILDSAMGEGRFISLLTCVSETQRDDKKSSVNEICVPGTIILFQEYLAKLGGIYYLDPPRRYLQLSDDGEINVASLGALLTTHLSALVTRLQTNRPVAASQ